MKPYPVELTPAHYQETYLQAPQELAYLRDDDGKYHTFHRSGVTAPGYPERACYVEYTDRDVEWWNQTGPAYVLDGRRLWLSSEWHAYYREHGVTPAGGLA